MWPLLVAVLVRRRRGRVAARRMLVASVMLALASLTWTLVIFDPADPSRVYYGTDTRIASILLGAALAAWLALRGPVRTVRTRVALEAGAIASFALLAVVWTRSSGSSNLLYRGGLFVCAIATVVVIAAAVHPRRGPVHRRLVVPPVVRAGAHQLRRVPLALADLRGARSRRVRTSTDSRCSASASPRRSRSRSCHIASSSCRSGAAPAGVPSHAA